MIKLIKLYMIMFSSVAILIFTACDSDDDDKTNRSTGQLLDSAVGGIYYVTYDSDGNLTHSGTTNSDGEFRFLVGETIIFSVGSIELPEVTVGSIITPLEIGDGTVTDDAVINITRFLQSLDSDDNPSNGISIASDAAVAAADATLDFSVDTSTFEADISDLLETLDITLVSEGDAIAHLEITLEGIDSEIIIGQDVTSDDVDCDSGWTLIVTTGGFAAAGFCSPAVPTLSVFQSAITASSAAGATFTNVTQTIDTATEKEFTATINVTSTVPDFGDIETTTEVVYNYTAN